MIRRKRKPALEKVAVCRICVVGDVRMHNVVDVNLQEIYQKLTSMPFETGDSRPSLVCYMCYDRLRKCYQFSVKCVETEGMFTQMLSNNKKKVVKLETNLEPFKGFSVTPVLQLYVDGSVDVDDVKEELPDVPEQHDDDELPLGSDDYKLHVDDEIHSDVEDDAMLPVTNTDADNIQNDLNNEYKEVLVTKAEPEADCVIDTSPQVKHQVSLYSSIYDDPLAVNKSEIETTSDNETVHHRHNNEHSTIGAVQLRKSSENVTLGKKISDADVTINNTNNDTVRETKDSISRVLSCTGDKRNMEQCDVNIENKSYQCNFCPFKRSNKSYFIRHIRRHTREKAYICDICEFKCFERGHLIRHIRRHTGEKPYKCDICEFACNQRSSLKRHIRLHTSGKLYNQHKQCDDNLTCHIRRHTGEKPYICDICEYSCKQKNVMISHIRTHTGDKPYMCDICPFACSQQSSLNRHVRTHTSGKLYKRQTLREQCHDDNNLKFIRRHTGEKPYICDICQYSCKQKNVMISHIRRHTGDKPYMCDICPYRCIQKYALILHMRKHTGEKPYQCELCPSSFKKKCQLNSHIREHTGEKPYHCVICPSSFSKKSQLNSHLRLHPGEINFKCHTCQCNFSCKRDLNDHNRLLHPAEKPYKCNLCPYRSRWNSDLTKHKRIHTVEKLYTCDGCQHGFSRKNALICHIRQHTDCSTSKISTKPPYNCDVCQYSTNFRSSLVMHKRRHTGEKPYSCNICEYRCRSKPQLTIHIRKHTRERPFTCNICQRSFSTKSNLNVHLKLHA